MPHHQSSTNSNHQSMFATSIAATTTSGHRCTRQKAVARCALVRNPVTADAPVVHDIFIFPAHPATSISPWQLHSSRPHWKAQLHLPVTLPETPTETPAELVQTVCDGTRPTPAWIILAASPCVETVRSRAVVDVHRFHGSHHVALMPPSSSIISQPSP